jgi:hypothetical protein
MADLVFELQVERSRWEGYDPREMPEWDGVLVEFEDREYFRTAFWKPDIITGLPDRIAFDAGYEDLPRMDYLYNNAQWPIMSKWMLSNLLSVHDFPRQIILLVMIDDEMRFDRQLDKRVRTGRESHDYIALQLLEHQDLFDWENSVYEHNPNKPNPFNSLQTLVLKTPETGFPPIFRIPTLPRRLFVSAQARAALETAALQGLKFIPLSEFQFKTGDTIALGNHPDFRPTLSRQKFENINNPPYSDQRYSYNYEEIFFGPIFSYIFQQNDTAVAEIEVFSVLTPGQRILMALTEFIGQTMNGGIDQFFVNKSEFYWWQALKALDQIGDIDMGQAYAIELQRFYPSPYQQTRMERLAECNGSVSYISHAANYRKTPPPYAKTGRFSWDYFYDHQRKTEEKLVDYINRHPEEFVIFADE